MQCNGCCFLILIRYYILYLIFSILEKIFLLYQENIFGVLERTSSDIYRHPIQYITLYALQFYKNTHYIKQSITLHYIKQSIILKAHKKRKHKYYGQDEVKCGHVFDTFPSPWPE